MQISATPRKPCSLNFVLACLVVVGNEKDGISKSKLTKGTVSIMHKATKLCMTFSSLYSIAQLAREIVCVCGGRRCHFLLKQQALPTTGGANSLIHYSKSLQVMVTLVKRTQTFGGDCQTQQLYGC